MTPMEQAAIDRLGLFAHYLGIRPWEIGDLSVEQFLTLCKWVDDANKPAKD